MELAQSREDAKWTDLSLESAGLLSRRLHGHRKHGPMNGIITRRILALKAEPLND